MADHEMIRIRAARGSDGTVHMLHHPSNGLMLLGADMPAVRDTAIPYEVEIEAAAWEAALLTKGQRIWQRWQDDAVRLADLPFGDCDMLRHYIDATLTAQFPALTGTEKQVAWATKIRRTKTLLPNIDARNSRTIDDAEPYRQLMIALALHHPPARTAKWWIEVPENYPRALSHPDDRYFRPGMGGWAAAQEIKALRAGEAETPIRRALDAWIAAEED